MQSGWCGYHSTWFGFFYQSAWWSSTLGKVNLLVLYSHLCYWPDEASSLQERDIKELNIVGYWNQSAAGKFEAASLTLKLHSAGHLTTPILDPIYLSDFLLPTNLIQHGALEKPFSGILPPEVFLHKHYPGPTSGPFCFPWCLCHRQFNKN